MRIVLQKAPVSVIRDICNVTLNAREGDVRISSHLKQIFAKYNNHIYHLTDRRCCLVEKRRLLVQRGNVLPIIAFLIAIVLDSINKGFIVSLFYKNEKFRLKGAGGTGWARLH